MSLTMETRDENQNLSDALFGIIHKIKKLTMKLINVIDNGNQR